MFGWLSNPKDPSILDRLFKLYDYDKDGKVRYISLQSHLARLEFLIVTYYSFQEVTVTLGLLSRGAPGEKISVRVNTSSLLLRSRLFLSSLTASLPVVR